MLSPESDGRGLDDQVIDFYLAVCDRAENALAFASRQGAWRHYTQISQRCPIGRDQKPNRPLTRFDVEVVPV